MKVKWNRIILIPLDFFLKICIPFIKIKGGDERDFYGLLNSDELTML